MEGIVLKSIDYKEKSKIVYLYTPEGIQSVKALDANKTKLSFITTLNHVEFLTTASKLPTVTEYSLKRNFYSMYKDIKKIGVLAPILDVIFHLEDDANHKRIYPFFVQTISELEKTEEPLFILSTFLIKMLSVFGIKPELKKCVFCSNTSIVNFSIPDGGALCQEHANFNQKNFSVYEAFYTLYYNHNYDLPQVNIEYTELLKAIYSYYAIHANLKLKDYHL